MTPARPEVRVYRICRAPSPPAAADAAPRNVASPLSSLAGRSRLPPSRAAMAAPNAPLDPRRARQKASVTVLGVGLIVAGLVVALLLHRIALPLRLLIGLGDVVAGPV